MGFNRFYLNILIHVSLITFFCMDFVYFVFEKQQYTTSILFFVFIVLITGRLVYYLNRTNRLLGMYFVYLNENDMTLAWSSKFIEKNFKGLQISLHGIMEKLKQIRIEKEVQARYLQTIVDNVNVGIITVNSTGKVDIMNKAAIRFLNTGYVRNLVNLDEIHSGLGSKLEKLIPGKPLLEKFVVDGQLYMLSIKATKIKNLGEENTIYTFHDIKNEMEEQEINAWKKLIRVITHEIMNSITPITTLTLAIRKRLIKDNKKKRATEVNNDDIKAALSGTEIIEERSKGLVHFIEKYQKITKLPPLRVSNENISELFERIIRLFREQLDQKGIKLITDIHQIKKLKVDPQMVDQVMINLVKNSLEALKKTKHPLIELKSYLDKDQRIVISIRDNGVGIHEKHKEDIFVPFFTTKEEGSGIGLNICRQIMRLHKGDIYVNSQQGEGTVVRLVF
jgi:two-component system nitrogen regulation sensor histidine kinase NtrY